VASLCIPRCSSIDVLLPFPPRRSSDLDGHTASLFPGSRDLERALQGSKPYAALDASGCPVAKDWHLRITLTPRGLAAIGTRLLRSEEHTSELQSRENLVCRLLLEKKNT